MKTQVTFGGDNATEMGANAQEKYNDARKNGIKDGAIKMSGKSNNNNTTDADETTIAFDSSQTNVGAAVTNAVQNAVNNGADINKLNVVGDSEDISNGTFLNESDKVYTKKQIMEARLKKMREEGKVMTKKQLRESFK